MALIISRANPLRFKQEDKDVNYTTIYPKFDLMELRTSYQRGIYSGSYYANFPLSTTIKLQVANSDTIIYAKAKNINTGTLYSMTISNVTPSGWTTEPVYNLSISTNTLGEGIFHIEFIAEVDTDELKFISDQFIITDASNKKDLIEIQYYDTENKFDGVFNDGAAWIWQPKRYFTGLIAPAEGNTSYSLYQDDAGITSKINAEVIDGMLINITDVSQYEKAIIDRIFGCDNIIVNGVSIQNTEPPSYTPIDKSDLCNIAINATVTEENGNIYNY